MTRGQREMMSLLEQLASEKFTQENVSDVKSRQLALGMMIGYPARARFVLDLLNKESDDIKQLEEDKLTRIRTAVRASILSFNPSISHEEIDKLLGI